MRRILKAKEPEIRYVPGGINVEAEGLENLKEMIVETHISSQN